DGLEGGEPGSFSGARQQGAAQGEGGDREDRRLAPPGQRPTANSQDRAAWELARWTSMRVQLLKLAAHHAAGVAGRVHVEVEVLRRGEDVRHVGRRRVAGGLRRNAGGHPAATAVGEDQRRRRRETRYADERPAVDADR